MKKKTYYLWITIVGIVIIGMTGCGRVEKDENGNIIKGTFKKNEAIHVKNDYADAMITIEGVEYNQHGTGFNSDNTYTRIKTTVDCSNSTLDNGFNSSLTYMEILDSSNNIIDTCFVGTEKDSISYLLNKGDKESGYFYCANNASSVSKLQIVSYLGIAKETKELYLVEME